CASSLTTGPRYRCSCRRHESQRDLHRRELSLPPRTVSEGHSALLVALAFDHMDLVQLLIARGADVYQPANYGTLFQATSRLAKVLLDSGADPNEGSQDGETPLMEAAVW